MYCGMDGFPYGSFYTETLYKVNHIFLQYVIIIITL